MNFSFFSRPILVLSIGLLTIITCADTPSFIWFFCFLLWAHKWFASRNLAKISVKPISRKMTTALAIGIFTIILLQYKTLFVQEAASSLLVALTAIKVLDYANQRDHLITVLLGFLLLTLKPLFGLELFWLPMQFICMFGLFWSLTVDNSKIPKKNFLTIIASSIPFSIALFLIFPRVVLPWAIAQAKLGKSAKIGFTTELKPGQFSDLSESNETVFRASFPEGLLIDAKEMYWRGAVLTNSQGISWEKPNNEIVSQNLTPDIANSFNYEILSENMNGHYLFALDSTYKLHGQSMKAESLKNNIWRLSGLPVGSQRFRASASWPFRDTTLPSNHDLQHPTLPDQARSWVSKVIKEHKSLQERRIALRELFGHPQFTYTQKPGTYGEDAIDEFLFKRRRGFCEHFAGSYATLARALNIPARVISGYQGGDYNPVGKFWRITQRSAHAWVEIWDGSAWQRVDPTSWANIVEFNRSPEKRWSDWITEGLEIYENINYRWTTFLLDFDSNTEIQKLKEFLPKVVVFVLLLLSFVFAFRAIFNWLRIPKSERTLQHKLMLSKLIEEIRSNLESHTLKNCAALTPLQVISSAKANLFGPPIFYQNLSMFYDQLFYQEVFDEKSLIREINDFQKKWVEIQLLRSQAN